MRRWELFVVGSFVALLSVASFAAEEVSPVEQYKQDRLAKRAYERFLYAKEMLEQSPDAAIISEAVQDAVRYATNKDEDTKALQAIETALERLPKDGGDWREAMLARGKMLTRLDRKDEAEVFFQDAIKNNWQNAMWRYSESLIDSDYMADACILECKRIGGLEKYAKYRGDEESLEIFLTLLRLSKDFDSNISLTGDVAGKLDSIADQPEFVQIAQALCAAEDGNPGEGVALLDKLDIQLSEKKEHREYKHIPLYKASILFKEGKDYPAAQAAFTEFMKRNEGKNKVIIASALRLSRDLEINKQNYHKMDELATYLINSDWFKDESVQNDLIVDDIASLYDMQQIGLAWSGFKNQSYQVRQHIIENFPYTLAAANCMKTNAFYMMHRGQKIEAVQIYNDLLENYTDDNLCALIHYYLALIASGDKDYESALLHIQHALDFIPSRCKGLMLSVRTKCLRSQDNLLNCKASE